MPTRRITKKTCRNGKKTGENNTYTSSFSSSTDGKKAKRQEGIDENKKSHDAKASEWADIKKRRKNLIHRTLMVIGERG